MRCTSTRMKNRSMKPCKSTRNNNLPSTDRLQAILFDIDGTLTDSDPLHLRTFQEMLVELGYNDGKVIDEAFFQKMIAGRHNDDIANDLFPDLDKDRQREIFEEKEARFRKLAEKALLPINGLNEFLKWIDHRGLKKAAVTNAPRANAEIMLRGLGLEDYFQHVIIGAECTRAKPYPDPYLTAMDRCGVSAESVIVIEDSPAGISASVAAGITTVGIQTGQLRTTLEEAGVAVVIKDYYDLMNHLDIMVPSARNEDNAM